MNRTHTWKRNSITRAFTILRHIWTCAFVTRKAWLCCTVAIDSRFWMDTFVREKNMDKDYPYLLIFRKSWTFFGFCFQGHRSRQNEVQERKIWEKVPRITQLIKRDGWLVLQETICLGHILTGFIQMRPDISTEHWKVSITANTVSCTLWSVYPQLISDQWCCSCSSYILWV